MAGWRTRFRKRQVGRGCAELQTAGKDIMWRYSSYYSFRFLLGLLYQKISKEPHGWDLETLSEPAEGMCGLNQSGLCQPVWTTEIT